MFSKELTAHRRELPPSHDIPASHLGVFESQLDEVILLREALDIFDRLRDHELDGEYRVATELADVDRGRDRLGSYRLRSF